jgi:hypothetical protein
MPTGIKVTKAMYGTGTTTVDVTKAVASHVKDGKLYLVVSADSLNVKDPAPGQNKKLMVAYTINDGKENSQTVDENGVLLVEAPPEVDATGLEIVKAEYGYAGNFTDVTDALINYVKDGNISVKVNPGNLGIPDPNPNKQKSLEVQYKLNGAANIAYVKDGETFQVSAPSAEGSDNTTPAQNFGSILYTAYRGIFYFFMSFLYSVSVFAAADFGGPPGSTLRLFTMAMGFLLPGVAFWGLPFYVFFRRLFSSSDIVV